MIIGDRLRELREQKKFSQGEIEKRTGLLRCYISRVENGHTVPAVETLEKFARALEVPMYQLFYDGVEPPKLPNLPKRRAGDDLAWGSKGKDARLLGKFCRLFSRMEAGDLGIVLFMAQKMASRNAVWRFGSVERGGWLPWLHREWAAYNPIRDRNLEMIVAVDALNRLVPHLCAVSAGGNTNLLFDFTVSAFHRHHDIALVGHRWAS
jgi:transcriptional regulator with XRE-family HTH domain